MNKIKYCTGIVERERKRAGWRIITERKGECKKKGNQTEIGTREQRKKIGR